MVCVMIRTYSTLSRYNNVGSYNKKKTCYNNVTRCDKKKAPATYILCTYADLGKPRRPGRAARQAFTAAQTGQRVPRLGGARLASSALPAQALPAQALPAQALPAQALPAQPCQLSL
eukprot:3866035-Pyramimonas_sp.AAC.1